MIEVKGLAIALPGFALKDITFTVPDHCYAILMGKTGCGKTTLLEAICGLRKVDAGTITLHGKDITHAKPGERGIGYVPQDGALFPTMTIYDQLAFAMQLRKWDKQKQKRRIDELVELLGIGHLLKRRPRGLSGGERQRVALGRALAFGPSVLMLDEPLSALDEDTRGRMMDLLQRVHQLEHVTALHITHSSSEARRLGTHVLGLVEGGIGEINHEGHEGRRGMMNRQDAKNAKEGS